MKHHELQKPLIQSALVLVAIIVLIGFVAGSDANTFLDGIGSIFKGLFYSVLFAIALVIALAVSVVFLVAIFFGAVALYSRDASRELYKRFRNRLATLISSWSCCSREATQSCKTEEEGEIVVVSSDHSLVSRKADDDDTKFVKPDILARINEIETAVAEEITASGNTVELLRQQNLSLNDSVTALQSAVEKISVAEILESIDALEIKQKSITTELSQGFAKIATLESLFSQAEENAKRWEAKFDELRKILAAQSQELEQCKENMSKPVEVEKPTIMSGTPDTTEYRIFSYLDKKEDQKHFTELIEEAIRRDMTYAEIDTFLSTSLPKNIDIIIKEHPSLTQDYIRALKKTVMEQK